MRRWIMLLAITTLVFSCSSSKHVKDSGKNAHNTITEGLPQNPLQVAKSYVQLAKNAEQIGDTLGAEYYFDKAMDISLDFQKQNPSRLDSISQKNHRRDFA